MKWLIYDIGLRQKKVKYFSFFSTKDMSQNLTKGTFWQLKAKVRYLQRKKGLAVVNNYRKFEEIIFTNNKDMCV